ncbi:MAG: polyphosphate polymerase domain-containing protein [Flavobacteriales bacterium]|nr:polyphosphate polymerase domain-containing protein [Flavobacteriales bacterium]MCB9167456.1 polyphosphate polymerase domain-containing protein [Flavobacteriales bacterium]
MSELRPVIERFAPITLAEMDAVRLQDRVDTKYVIPAAGIPALLEHLSSWYRVLEVEGVRGINYRTLYLDTPDLRSYLDHHNGRVLRSKVRFREYVDSGICFLEVKRKTGRGRTDKVRMPVDRIITPMTPDQLAFVHRYQGDGAQTPLVPMLWNMFSRLTLVHDERAERLTLDLALRFADAAPEGRPVGEVQGMPGIVVAELKQPRADRTSPFVQAMRAANHHPQGFSKYCIGMLQVNNAPKRNLFKPILRHIHELSPAA